MTKSRDVRPEVIAAAFSFARQQDTPKFRSYLRRHGWRPGVDVVIALDDDRVVAVVRRMFLNTTSVPCLVAIPNPVEHYGFGLMLAEVSSGRPKRKLFARDEPIVIQPESTIGMVWSLLQTCGEYVPDGWAQPVMFEKMLADA